MLILYLEGIDGNFDLKQIEAIITKTLNGYYGQYHFESETGLIIDKVEWWYKPISDHIDSIIKNIYWETYEYMRKEYSEHIRFIVDVRRIYNTDSIIVKIIPKSIYY